MARIRYTEFQTLPKKRVRNDPDTWIRAPNSFPALIDPALHEAANQIIAARSARLSDEDMLAALQALLERQGALSGMIIDEADATPSSSAYSHRFGSLLRAYHLVGFRPRRDYGYIEINRDLRRLHPDVVDAVLHGIGVAHEVSIPDFERRIGLPRGTGGKPFEAYLAIKQDEAVKAEVQALLVRLKEPARYADVAAPECDAAAFVTDLLDQLQKGAEEHGWEDSFRLGE